MLTNVCKGTVVTMTGVTSLEINHTAEQLCG